MLNENEYSLLKIAQSNPGAWYLTYEKFRTDLESLEKMGLIEMIHEVSPYGIVYYRFIPRTLH